MVVQKWPGHGASVKSGKQQYDIKTRSFKKKKYERNRFNVECV
jgi:hypothetical protein